MVGGLGDVAKKGCAALCLLLVLHRVAGHAQVCRTLDWSTAEAFDINPTGPTSGQFPPPARVAIDRVGDIYVSGTVVSGSDFDLRTCKYSCSGALLWSRTYNRGTTESPSFALPDTFRGMALDSEGNLYIAAETHNAVIEDPDITVIKYDVSGSLEWARHVNVSQDAAAGIALASSGTGDHVFVAGYAGSLNQGPTDFVVQKVAADGSLPSGWSSPLTFDIGFMDVAKAVSAKGDLVYVVGDADSDNIVTSKINGVNKSIMWARSYHRPDSSSNNGFGVAVSDEEDVFSVGHSAVTDGIDPPGYDYTILKYAPTGSLVAARFWHRTTTDKACFIALDPTGDVYVTGYSGSDWATVKCRNLDLEFSTTWPSDGPDVGVRLYLGSGMPHGLAVDTHGDVYVCGTMGSDCLVTKYRGVGSGNVLGGDLRWEQRIPLDPSASIGFSGVAINDAMQVAVTGDHTARILQTPHFSDATGSYSADTNGDFLVDDADVTNVILDYGGPVTGMYGMTDVNCDGEVDDADLTAVIVAYGMVCDR